jgi:uncharacterized protein (DUF362 family)
MSKKFNRRDFIKVSAIATSGAIILPQVIKGNAIAESIDIAVFSGKDMFNNTILAIEQLGGISKFVPQGSKVGLLINTPPQFSKPGSCVHTDIILAVLKLLNDAGAKEIAYINNMSEDVFKRSEKSVEYEDIIKNIKNYSDNYRDIEIPKAIILKNAQVVNSLIECDVFINIPITKHHGGSYVTNCLKNYMGACKRETNLFFHKKDEANNDDAQHLAQCIADVNLLRKPDLCVCDATEILKTNGPFGPGEIIKPMKIYAGTDPVALDAYGATILGNSPVDIPMIVMANQHKIGTLDLKSLNIKEN